MYHYPLLFCIGLFPAVSRPLFFSDLLFYPVVVTVCLVVGASGHLIPLCEDLQVTGAHAQSIMHSCSSAAQHSAAQHMISQLCCSRASVYLTHHRTRPNGSSISYGSVMPFKGWSVV